MFNCMLRIYRVRFIGSAQRLSLSLKSLFMPFNVTLNSTVNSSTRKSSQDQTRQGAKQNLCCSAHTSYLIDDVPYLSASNRMSKHGLHNSHPREHSGDHSAGRCFIEPLSPSPELPEHAP